MQPPPNLPQEWGGDKKASLRREWRGWVLSDRVACHSVVANAVGI